MPIEPIQSGLQSSISLPPSRVIWTGTDAASRVSSKHFGEAIPDVADIRANPALLEMFGRLGVLERLRRKLNTLSRKRARLVPGKKTVACALRACEETDFEDVIFAGVEFAEEYRGEEDTMAGVLAHEYGHLLSDWTKGLNPDAMTWEEIFERRKEEEAAADGYAGKMLFQMGYSPEGMVKFLKKIQKKECLKYHSPSTREAIIRRAFSEAHRKQNQMVNLRSMFSGIASNPFTAKLIAVA